MGQTKQGALKVAAQKIGITTEEYAAKKSYGLKWCFACKQWKGLNLFNKDMSRTDGFTAKCTDCRYKPKTNRIGTLARRQKLGEGLAWCRGCAAWIDKREVSKGVCKACCAAEARTRYAENPFHRAERQQHAHSRKRNIAAISAQTQMKVTHHFTGSCAYCGSTATTFDHVIPASKGGGSGIDNIVPACAACNSSKKANDVDAWLKKTKRVPLPEFYTRSVLT